MKDTLRRSPRASAGASVPALSRHAPRRTDDERRAAGSPAPYRFTEVSVLPRSLEDEEEEDEREEEEPEVVSLPENGDAGGGGAGGGGAGAIRGTGPCDAPLLMRRVLSGPFKFGLTIDDYYPTLSGHDYWGHAGTAGPFVTSKYAGSNVQLIGVIPSSCDPRDFQLKQTVQHVVNRVNGAVQPLEGQTIDDLGASGWDVSRPPFRQERRDALGIHISMGDAPAARFRGQPNLELDRNFVTSLVGPADSQSVTWSQSIRFVNGRVTKNEVS